MQIGGGVAGRAGFVDRGAPVPLAGLATVGFLGLAAGTQMSDRGIQAILLPAIKASFAVGDGTIGALQGMAGILVASALAVPLARIADRVSRKRILLALIAAWGVLTAISAVAPSFPLFFIGRAASGVTEFAMIPVVYSLIPDLVDERWRVNANLAFAALMATGASAGFYFGGAFVDLAVGLGGADVMPGALEPWRRVLLLLSLAAIPLLLLGLLTVDPPRGREEGSDATAATLAAFVRAQWRSILLFVGTAGGLAIAVQSLTPMIAMALERRFAVGIGPIGHALGIITLVTSVACLPLAGVVDRALRLRFGARSRPLVMATMAIASIPCAVAMGFAADERSALVLVTIFLFLTCTANALIPTMLQDLAPASLRARSFATYSFVIAVFCALGPVLSGNLSDRVFEGDLLTAIGASAAPSLALAAGCAALSVIALAPRR